MSPGLANVLHRCRGNLYVVAGTLGKSRDGRHVVANIPFLRDTPCVGVSTAVISRGVHPREGADIL